MEREWLFKKKKKKKKFFLLNWRKWDTCGIRAKVVFSWCFVLWIRNHRIQSVSNIQDTSRRYQVLFVWILVIWSASSRNPVNALINFRINASMLDNSLNLSLLDPENCWMVDIGINDPLFFFNLQIELYLFSACY